MNSFDKSNDLERWGVPAIESTFNIDPKLRDFEKDIRRRYAIYEKARNAISDAEGLDNFSRCYKDFGINVLPDNGVICREWAPNALAMHLRGTFNNWEDWSYEAKPYGKWEMYIPPNSDGSCRINHLSELQIVIETKSGERLERVSPWARYVVEENSSLKWKFWNPPRREVVLPTNRRPKKPTRLRIYEAHIGIASNRCEVTTYRQFTDEVLPRIRDLGYNCVMLMAIQETPQYDDMGRHVTNFFAPSSRFGNPEDLKQLINIAHGMGITVMMDIEHGQASDRAKFGLNMFDGSAEGYFHDRKTHGNRHFDYTKWEVLRFLTSNLRYFMDEFNMDGFRFNSVTTMLYQDRSKDRQPSDDYRQYFGIQMDLESMAYLMLANDMLHNFYPHVLTVAEDNSEMPGMCRPLREGGLGFDYRLGNAVPNKWMKLLNESRDEDWNMGFIFHAMTSQRKCEKTIAMAESRDQSMRGSETLVSKLMRHEMYENMSDNKPLSHGIDRGLSLHKMIRLMTHTLAGDGYVNFIGNEFGHPDHVELPSFENNWNRELARRRFELCDDEQLRYKYLWRFDKSVNQLEEKYNWLSARPGFVSRKDETDKVFVFERANLIFLFNFHPTNSYPGYRIGVDKAGSYKIVLDSDEQYFGGHGRLETSVDFQTQPGSFDNRSNSVLVYLPSRTAIVMANTSTQHTGYYNYNVADRGTIQTTTSYGRSIPSHW